MEKLRADNKRLRSENAKLKSQVKTTRATSAGSSRISRFFRGSGAVLFIALSVAILMLGNILFWAGNTLVKTDNFVASTAPIIRDPAVQTAIATKTTTELFQTVDVQQVITDALPPRADFLAPTIATQVKSHTQEAIQKLLARPQFQDRWNNTLKKVHSQFISAVGKNGSDGSININEVYSSVSQQLKTTRLAFLANKPLPQKVGNIQLVSGTWLKTLSNVIRNIDAWQIWATVLFVLSGAAGVWMSRNRRKAVGMLGIFAAVTMFATLLALRITREVIASKVDAQYATAARDAYTIFMHPLVVQTWTIFAAGLVVGIGAWLSGTTRSAHVIRERLNQLFAGKLHQALFPKENAFTKFVGQHARILQWVSLVLVAIVGLVVRLTPGTLAVLVLVLLITLLLINTLGEPQKS